MHCCKLHKQNKYKNWACRVEGYSPTERREMFEKRKTPCLTCGKAKSPDATYCTICVPTRGHLKGKKLPPAWCKAISEGQKGEKGPGWKGGVTPLNKIERQSVKFKEWRKAVFTRDNYICQECQVRGGELHPDHIFPFALFHELRFELSNGRTLCRACHIKTPTWGGKMSKYNRESFLARFGGTSPPLQ